MLSVVIPLYNEEDNIAPLQEELAAALQGREYELVLIDDCSTDKTLERIQRGPGVRVIEFAKNAGQSAAMYVGVHAAKGDRHGNLVFHAVAMNFNPLAAMAGRTTIAEVEELVEPGDLDPGEVHCPGIFVQRVVHAPGAEKRIERRTVSAEGSAR